MKRFTSIFAGMALAIGMTTMAFAADSAPVKFPITGSIGLNYWMSSASISGTGGGKVDQDFFPMLTGTVGVTPQISVLGEYSTAGSKSPSGSPTESFETDKFMIGGEYKLQASPINIKLTYVDTKTKYSDSTPPASSLDIKVSGIRLGVGAEQKFEGSPITASINLAMGISNKASYSGGAVSIDSDANVTSFDLKLGYEIPNSPIKPVLGYRYESAKIDEIASVSFPKLDTKTKGVFLGVEYGF